MTSVHLTNAWHGESGGVRRHYLDLLAAADELDWRMRLIVPGARTSVERVGRLGRIYTLRAPTAPAFDRRYRLLLPPAYLRPSRGAIVRILRRERADIVETADKFCLPYLSALVRKGLVGGLGRPTLVGHSTERLDAVLGAHVAQNDLTRAFARWYMHAIYVPPFDFCTSPTRRLRRTRFARRFLRTGRACCTSSHLASRCRCSSKACARTSHAHGGQVSQPGA